MGYFAGIVRALVGEPIALPAKEARDYPELIGARLRRGGLPPRVAGWFLGQPSVSAITLHSTIFLGQRAIIDAPLLLHEFRHIEQFRERGTFPLRYICESLRRGYHKNRYEVDARTYAARRLGQPVRTPPVEEV
jgi:hypothetical protein